MTGSISTLGQAIRQIENLNTQQAQISDLTTQLATGKRSQNYSGLSTDALASLRSRTELSSLDVYINNIQRADTTIQLTLRSVEEFQAQTGELSGTLINFLQQGDHLLGEDVFFDDPATPEEDPIRVGKTSSRIDADFDSVINHAQNLFGFLESTINAQQGDRYLFAGADSLERPYTDTGTLDAAVSTLITEWKAGTITTEELIDDLFDGTALDGNPNAISDSTIGFSSSLSDGNAGDVFVRADDNSEFSYTVLGNNQNFRDLIVILGVLKNENLPPIIDVYEDGVFPGVPDAVGAPGQNAAEQQDSFYQLYNELVQKAGQAVDELDQTRFRLESVRVQINETSEQHIEQRQLLLNTVSSIEDVDINEVAVSITALQTRLQASYNVTAITQQLTLANFLN